LRSLLSLCSWLRGLLLRFWLLRVESEPLVAVLVWSKRKRAAKPDPSERTDFEIEFKD